MASINPFKNIALSLSGGGYRASCFSLGTLSFLNHILLLESVDTISTVSGGTITGVAYTYSQLIKSDFSEFYNEYHKWLSDDKLKDEALKHLNDKKIWKTPENIHKKRNPINSFSIEYNKLTGERNIGDVDDMISKENTHLKRVIFNAADMSTGLQFRFQNTTGGGWDFGNGKLDKVYSNTKYKTKLGDIIAASSAFPGGFEPMSFPSDFVPDSANLTQIGLMDGGTVDNQGSSIFTMSKNNKNDLILVCDVSSPYINEPFLFFKGNGYPVTLFILMHPLSFITSLICFLTSVYYFNILVYTLFVITTLTTGIALLLKRFITRKIKTTTGIREKIGFPSSELGKFLIDRINSLIKMATDVFLKNDRRQQANLLYRLYHKKSSTITIYSLRCNNENGHPENETHWLKIKNYIGNIPGNIKDISKECADFGTTLWFSKNDKSNNTLNKLIACGEFTTCYNLIAFLIKEREIELEDENSAESQLLKELLTCWKKFRENPMYLNEQRGILN